MFLMIIWFSVSMSTLILIRRVHLVELLQPEVVVGQNLVVDA